MFEVPVPMPRIAPQPPKYFCPRAKGEFVLDGNINKPFWENVPFTADFIDISGRDFPTPRFRTRAKICWDDEALYVAALLEGNEIWATIAQRDSVMYYDNDFEVFIDPSSSTHNYMELEMNALNTQWDLMLTMPYRNGGRSVSAWNMPGVESACVICGALNDPAADNKFWSVEIKIPFAGLLETYSKEKNPPELERCYPVRRAPRTGDVWRMNFSRVQWTVDIADGKYIKRKGADGRPLPEDNWVWAATGLIDIHYPETWAYVFFTESGEETSLPEAERVKLEMYKIYYAQHEFFRRCGRFAKTAAEAAACLPAEFALDSAVAENTKVETTSRWFELSCALSGGGTVVIQCDGFNYVE